MMRYDIRFEGIAINGADPRTPPAPTDLEAFMDVVVAELEKLSAEDIDVSTDLADCRVCVGISVERDDLLDANEVGNGIIRTAFHAAGARTHDWSVDWTMCTATPQDDLAAQDDLVDA